MCYKYRHVRSIDSFDRFGNCAVVPLESRERTFISHRQKSGMSPKISDILDQHSDVTSIQDCLPIRYCWEPAVVEINYTLY